jgi:hypothetical protein
MRSVVARNRWIARGREVDFESRVDFHTRPKSKEKAEVTPGSLRGDWRYSSPRVCLAINTLGVADWVRKKIERGFHRLTFRLSKKDVRKEAESGIKTQGSRIPPTRIDTRLAGSVLIVDTQIAGKGKHRVMFNLMNFRGGKTL